MADPADHIGAPERCSATTTEGKPCKAPAVDGSTWCKYHAPRLGQDDWDPAAPVTNEAAITAAFCRWLRDEGWSVETEVDGADVVARRAGVTMIAEAKGVTSSPGLDIDTMFGQVLRRIDPTLPNTQYAVVVPAETERFALRVPAAVRARLALSVFTVDRGGRVALAGAEQTSRPDERGGAVARRGPR